MISLAPNPRHRAGSSNSGFGVALDASTLVVAQITEISLPGNPASPADPALLVIVQNAAASLLIEGGRRTPLRRGDIAILDLTASFSALHRSGSAQIRCQLHGASIDGREDLRRTMILRHGDANSAIIERLLASLAAGARASGERVATIRALLIQLIGGSLKAKRTPDTSRATEPTHNRVRAFILANLASPGLSPATIALRCGTSVRCLHRLFEGSGHTLRGWIRHERLERCRRDLQDERCAMRSITEIAFGWGFSDAAHFSRTFRQTYGVAPSELRRRESGRRALERSRTDGGVGCA